MSIQALSGGLLNKTTVFRCLDYVFIILENDQEVKKFFYFFFVNADGDLEGFNRKVIFKVDLEAIFK